MARLTISPEGTYTDIERDFIENEPPGLLPGGQDSVWGQVRSTYAAYLQAIADTMTKWYGNLDPATVTTDDLPEWEYMLNLPQSNTALTDTARRNNVIARFGIGPFTHARREAIVQAFIAQTFGAAITFDPTGVPFVSAGTPFFSGVTNLYNTYYIIENIPGFSYEVRYLNTITLDSVGLLRELQRITPAGITLTLTPHTYPFHNYVKNSTFETDTSGWPTWGSGAGVPSLARTNVAPTQGAWAGAASISAAGAVYTNSSPWAPCYPGQRIWFRGMIRRDTANINELQLWGYFADGNQVTISSALVTDLTTLVTGTWYQCSGVAVAPPGAWYCSTGIAAYSTGAGGAGTASFDAMMVYPLVGNEPPPPASAFITD